MRTPSDITGLRSGLLVAQAISPTQASPGKTTWLCLCDCGKTAIVIRGNITSGHTKSCGCLNHRKKHGSATNENRDRQYDVWVGMRQRCSNPNTRGYKDYGGRGIKVCARWEDYATYLADIGPRPAPGMSIDRINNEGDYEPSNVRWSTRAEQQQNRRCVKLNADKVREIRRRHASGESSRTIANDLGVLPHTVIAVANRTSWKNVA